MASLLVDRGCDVNIRDVHGTTAFEEAVKKDQVQVWHNKRKTQFLDSHEYGRLFEYQDS